MSTDPEVISEAAIGPMVKEKAKELGGPQVAAEQWGCSPQLIHMVAKGARRPNEKMLDALGLEQVPQKIEYRRKA